MYSQMTTSAKDSPTGKIPIGHAPCALQEHLNIGLHRDQIKVLCNIIISKKKTNKTNVDAMLSQQEHGPIIKRSTNMETCGAKTTVSIHSMMYRMIIIPGLSHGKSNVLASIRPKCTQNK